MAMMKSSNTEWLGDIPAEWDVAQIGNYYELRNEKVSDYDFEPLSVTMKGIVPQLATAAKSDDHSNRKLVKKGDFVINSRSDRRGSCGISPLDGSVSLINTVMEPRGEMNPQYYNWLFHTEQFADEFYKWGHGIVDDLWTTRWQEMKKILIVAPSPDEQQAIADYLDETCSKIDEIIAEAKASIDEYKELKQSVIFEAVTKGLDKNVEMKECQLDSFQQIPKHWKECRIGTIYQESKETGRADLPILMISINTGISDGEVGDEERLRKVVRSEDKSVYKVVHKNDLAYNMMRAWQGGFGAAQVDGLVSPAYVVATPRTELDSRYIEALLRTPMFTEKIRGLSYGIADFRLRLYWNYFKDLKICLPPVDEQRKIADFVDKQDKMIEGLITEKQSLIADLEAYKKSLIYEVVTGKRRVV